MKFVWLTDLHYDTAPNWGLDLDARLSAAVDHINAHQADAALCVITGDLTNDGDAVAYRALRSRLDGLAMPFLPLVGNHDDRELVRALLDPPEAVGGYVQYAVETEAGVFLCLDTLRVGSSLGEVAAPCLDWLEAQLLACRDRSVYIFMHHPPALMHSEFDEIGLENRDAFLDILRRFDVQHIFAGHVHRRASGHVAGIPFSTLGAVSFQAPGPGVHWEWESFNVAHEPPMYGVVTLTADGVTIHSELFCDADYGQLAP